MGVQRATLKDGRTIDYVMVDDPPSGTMKEVYFTPDRSSVVCFYKDPTTAQDVMRMQRLEAILTKYNPTVLRSQGGSTPGGAAQSDTEAKYYQELFCWPTAIVVKPRFGLVTPTYPKNFFFEEGPAKGKEKNGAWFLGARTRGMLERLAPRELGSWINYFKVSIEMARAVARLHTAGLAHSDLSPNNVLIDPLNGRSVVIDIDSLVVPGLYPPDVLGTKGYIAPEVLSTISLPLKDPKRKHPSVRTDEHALAVLIYQYLLKRHPLEGRRIPHANSAEEQDFLAFGPQALYCEHPTDTSNRPEGNNYVPVASLGPHLSDLFQRTFVQGIQDPNRRPTANEWLKGLVKTWDLLFPCANSSCPSKWFLFVDQKQIRCPFCNTKPRQPMVSIKFRSEGRPGQWMPDGNLTPYHNAFLFPWHVYAKKFPGPDSDRTPMGYFAWHQNQWLLVNQNMTSLTSPGGNRVPVGQAVALTHGAKFRLSQEPDGRMAEVEVHTP